MRKSQTSVPLAKWRPALPEEGTNSAGNGTSGDRLANCDRRKMAVGTADPHCPHLVKLHNYVVHYIQNSKIALDEIVDNRYNSDVISLRKAVIAA